MTKLDAEVDELIAACQGDTRGVVAALILVNAKLEAELAELRTRIATSPLQEPELQAILH